MKRAHRICITCICALACLLGTAHWFHTKPVYAQQNTGYYYDGTFYITASVDVDSNYNLYVDSYMEVDFDDYEDIDEIEVDGYADQDGELIGGDAGYGDDYDPAEVPLQSNGPVAPGHEYGMESDGYACFDDGEGDCDEEYVGSAYTYVNVAYPPPQINSITPSYVYQGDQGNLTITGSNLVAGSGDQLTLNFSGGGTPFTLSGTPSSTTATFSYNFSGYPSGTYTLSVSNNEGTSNNETFAVIATPPQNPLANPCAVTSNPQAGYSSIVGTGTAGSGTLSVSFSGDAFAATSAMVSYGPNSTPSSIAAQIAALISKNYYRYGLGAKAYGPNVVYSGNTTLGTVSNAVTGSSFTTTTSPTTATTVENACNSAPPPPLSMYAVAYSAYIPVDHVLGPDTCTYTSPVLGSNPAPLIYRGDAWHNTYRVTQAVSLNFTTSQASGNFNDTGTTENYGWGSPYNGPYANLSPNDDDATLGDCYLRNGMKKAVPGWQISPTLSGNAATVNMTGSSQNPLSFPFGSISWNMTIYIDANSSQGQVVYDHTCYPSHQVKVANTTLYLYTPPDNSEGFIVDCLTGLSPHVTGTSSTKPIR